MGRPLLQHTALTARFKPGLTPMQHHWELFDADETQIGRTRITYGDGLAGKAMRRSMTLVGLASGTLQREEVLDADGNVVAHLTAHNGRKDFLTEVADPGGRPIAAMTREPATPVSTMSLTDEIIWGFSDRTEITFRNRVSQHRGFMGSDVISVTFPELPGDEPLRTLLVLAPVIAGISY